MTHQVDISATFEENRAPVTAEAIHRFFEQVKSSDSEPVMTVTRCSLVPDPNPDHDSLTEHHAVIQAQSDRFEAETLATWIKPWLNDQREGLPVLRSIDIIPAATARSEHKEE